MLEKMKIGRRLGVGFGVILALYIVLTAFALQRIYSLAYHHDQAYEHPFAVSTALHRINRNVIKIHDVLEHATDIDHKEAMAVLVDEIEALEEKVNDDFDIVGRLYLGDRMDYLEARAHFDKWMPVCDEIVALASEGRKAEAIQLERAVLMDELAQIEGGLAPLSAFAENMAKKLHDDAAESQDRAFRLMYALIALTILTIILLSRTITLSITEPLKKLSKATAEVGKGDLSTKIDVGTTDEIGELAADFNMMIANLQEATASRDEMNVEIEERMKLEEALKMANEALEDKVVERTKEVMEANVQLMRSEKLATIGRLSSSVGHELRNPLGVISNTAYFLKSRLGDEMDAKVKKHLDILTRTVSRANRVVSDLLDFSREKPIVLSMGDLNGLVVDALANVEVPKKVKVKKMLHVAPLDVEMDSAQMLHVIENLITNAVQAMPDGGSIEIESGVRNGHVELAIKDTGEGIPEDKLSQVFEPLYSTKVTGTGLGLAIVDGIVARHGGTVAVRSEEGAGTTFTVNLPRYSSEKGGGGAL